MAKVTPRLGITYPEGPDDNNTVLYVEGFALKMDAAVTYASGNFADRPVSTPSQPGIDGRLFYARDQGRLYLDFGTGWAVLDGGVTGEMKMWPAATAPLGYVLCDGSAYSRSAYAPLYAVIGNGYGAGDGSTTFNVPDLRGRMPVGADGTRPLGGVGGAATVALTTAQMPAHAHGGVSAFADRSLAHNHTGYTTVNSDPISHNHGGFTLGDTPDHTHIYSFSSGGIDVNGGTQFTVMSAANGNYSSGGASARHQHAIPSSGDLTHRHSIYADGVDHRHAISSEGSGAAHENMPPWRSVNYIIKTGL